jgi:hypothetical protein
VTIQEFLKATQDEFGFNPKLVMEKLGVRSLSGMNYREALETLRRQALREGQATPSRGALSRTPDEQARRPPEAQAPHFFDEELEEPEVVFDLDDEDAVPPSATFAEDRDGVDPLRALDREGEVSAPPPPPPAASSRSTAAQRAHAAAQGAASDEERIHELVAQLRSVQAGGVPSSHQRTAFRNIVVEELGDEKAKALVAGLYRRTPERLGPEQIDALLSWGKRDTFADDAELALVALRAERAAQAGKQASEQDTAGAEPAPSRPSRTPRS